MRNFGADLVRDLRQPVTRAVQSRIPKFTVQGAVFSRAWGSGFGNPKILPRTGRVYAVHFSSGLVQDFGGSFQGSVFRVQGPEFRVQGPG